MANILDQMALLNKVDTTNVNKQLIDGIKHKIAKQADLNARIVAHNKSVAQAKHQALAQQQAQVLAQQQAQVLAQQQAQVLAQQQAQALAQQQAQVLEQALSDEYKSKKFINRAAIFKNVV